MNIQRLQTLIEMSILCPDLKIKIVSKSPEDAEKLMKQIKQTYKSQDIKKILKLIGVH